MTKYIVKQKAISALINEANTHSNPVKRAYTRAAALIEQITAEDVQTVRRGRWIETHISLCKWIPEDEKEEGHSFYMAEMKCSYCERYNTKTFSLTLEKPDFCQHCGARMDLGDEKT